MNYSFFQPINETHGFAVEKIGNGYQIIFVSQARNEDGSQKLVKEATSRSGGRLHKYTSPFLAGNVIKREILPLYKKG